MDMVHVTLGADDVVELKVGMVVELVGEGATVEGVGYESWIDCGAVDSTARFAVEVH